MSSAYPSRLALPAGATGTGRQRAVAVPVTNLWRAPEVTLDLDGPMVGTCPDVAGWTSALGTDERLGLDGRLDTQLLLGEPVEVVAERDGWSEVRALWQPSSNAPEGYPGWVRTDHLAAPVVPAASSRAVAVVARGAAAIVDDKRLDLSYGTVLWTGPAADQATTGAPGGERIAVRLPGNRLAWLPAAVVTDLDPSYHPAALVDAARAFLGLGYLWGGLSSWGTDCSGLIHLSHRTLGWVVPRDADDQCAIATRRGEAADASPGDLYFFSRGDAPVHHVGYVSTDRSLLHAPATGRGVEEVEMSPERRATSIGAWQLSGTD